MGQQLPPLPIGSTASRAKIFISYSRSDAVFSQMLVSALISRAFDAFIDNADIAPGEPWKERLAGLIAAADTVVFVVSPDSIASSVCAWEIEESAKLGKRIIPIIARHIEGADAPPALRRLNWITCADGDDKNAALAKLDAGLRTDLAWVREHTRLGELAKYWDDQGRGKGATLRGADLEAAERWLDRRSPDANAPTSLHRDFIRSSRRASTARLRYLVGGSLLVALVAIGLAGFAEISRRDAQAQRFRAETATKEAVASADAAKLSAKETEEELAAAQRSESLSLAEQAIHEVDAGDVSQALAHGLKALPSDFARPDRLILRKAEFALARAVLSDRLRLALRAGRDQINDAIYSPDGKFIATGTRDGVVTLWDADSGRSIMQFEDKRNAILGLAFSPDSRMLATYHQFPASALVRDVSTGATIWDFQLPASIPGQLLFTPDGKKLISVANQLDTRPRVWDLQSGAQVSILDDRSHSSVQSVRAAAVAPDGRLLTAVFTPFRDTALDVWDPITAAIMLGAGASTPTDARAPWNVSEQLRQVDPDEDVETADFLDRGAGLVILGKRNLYVFDIDRTHLDGHIRFADAWDLSAPLFVYALTDRTALVGKSETQIARINLSDGRLLMTFNAHFPRYGARAVSPDGAQFAASAQDNSIHVWSLTTGKELFVLRGAASPIGHLEYSPDGARLMASPTPNVLVWDVQPNEKRLATSDNNPDAQIMAAKMDPLTVHDRTVRGDQSARPALMELTTGREIGNIAGQALDINGLRLSAHNDRMLVQRRGLPWTLWDLASESMLASLPAADKVGNAGFDGQGNRILARAGNDLSIHDSASGNIVKAFEPFEAVLDAYIGWEGKRIVVQVTSDMLEVRDAEGPTPPRRLKLAGRLYRWAMTDSDDRLLTADLSGSVSLWNLATGEQITTFAGIKGGEPFGSASGNAKLRPIKLESGGIAVLDTESGKTAWQGEDGHIIEQATLSPDESALAISGPGRAAIYRLDTGGVTFTLPVERGRSVASLAFSENSQAVLIRFAPAGVMLVDVATGRVLSRFDAAEKLAFAANGVAAISQGDTLTVLDCATGKLLRTTTFPKAIGNFVIDQSGRFILIITTDANVSALEIGSGDKKPVASLAVIPHELHFGASSGEALIYENDPLQAHGELTLREIATGKVLTHFAANWPEKMGLATFWITRSDPNGAYVAVSTPDDRINVFRSTDGSLASSMNWPNEQFADMAFSKGGDILTVLTETGNIAFMKAEGGEILGIQRGLGTFSQLPDAITPLSKTDRLLAVDSTGRVDVISLASLSFRSFFSGISEPGLGADLSSDGLLLATFSRQGVVRVWDTAVGAVLFETEVSSQDYAMTAPRIRFSDDGRRIVAMSRSSQLAVLDLPPFGQALIDKAATSLELADQGPAATEARKFRFGVITGVDPRGAVVLDVYADSPAMEAGIRLGDVILAVDGRTIAQPRDVADAFAKASATVRLDLMRGSEHIEMKIVISKNQ